MIDEPHNLPEQVRKFKEHCLSTHVNCSYTDSEHACRGCGKELVHGQFYTDQCHNCHILCKNIQDGTVKDVEDYRKKVFFPNATPRQLSEVHTDIRLNVPMEFWTNQAWEDHYKIHQEEKMKEIYKVA